MNHCVLYFESQMDQQRLPRPKKPIIADDEIMELLWQNGQVVIQRPTHCHVKKPPPGKNSDDSIRGGGTSSAREVENYNQYLFMQENEMASWLHYDDSPFNQTFSADSLNTLSATVNNNTTMQTPTSVVPSRPPVPPPRRMEHVQPRTPNFAYFAKHGVRTEPGPSSILNTATRESTVVDSCDTPAVMPAAVSEGDTEVAVVSTTFDEPGGSSSSEEAEPVRKVDEHDRKRKGIETEEWEYQSEDVDFESAEAKKNISGSSTKRSRAAEVHNLSERRRRDRINEKMKALQELIPRSNKSDKASMLDEAIDYLKSLQLQVQRVQLMQMMSMGCGMVPMMFPGIQQYMPTVGMGMGMEMGINRPVMPFPNMLSGSALPAAANLGPRFAMPPFHMPHVPTPGSSRTQAANQVDNNVISSAGTHDSNQSRIPNFNDPYQQYLGPHQMQFQLMQNQAMNQPNVSRPLEKPETRQSGDK